jgi:uncharacterized repeat protein (TIGR04138 family)
MTHRPAKTLEEVVKAVGKYPIDAYVFVQEGLGYTVQQVHGDPSSLPKAKRHVTGRQLCYGLRDLALRKWGMLTPIVLEHWNITCTLDFGKIVFALVENDLLEKSPADSLDDFVDVYEFSKVFQREDDAAPEQ